MRTEVEQRAREICFERLAGSPFKPWLFEHTPAAAVDAVDVYLAAVETSDLVIWLVGDHTSEAVERELSRGLELSMPFLVFLLPTVSRDDETLRWVGRMRASFKTKDITDLDDLGSELDAALSDFVTGSVRAARRPTASDLAYIDDRLRAIGMVRWAAVGVGTEKAMELVSDLALGSLSLDALPSETEPIKVLHGPVGAGKTIAALRFMQRAVAQAKADRDAAYPVWAEPGDGAALDRAVAVALERGGRPPGSAVIVVVDGLDEVSPAAAGLILEQARRLAFMSSSNRVLLTSRPVGLNVRTEEAAMVPPLNIEETVALIRRSFGIDISNYTFGRLAEPVKTAIERPLFALLLGRRLATGQGDPLAVGELIASLVADAIGSQTAEALSTNRRLATLAQMSLDRGAQRVRSRLLGSRAVVRELLDTRLVTESAGELSFSLPILREWFGGVALELGLANVEDLASQPAKLERWRHAVFLALATLPEATVDQYMVALARSVPGFASEAMAATSWQEASGSEDAVEIGLRFFRATDALCGGLRDVSEFMGQRLGGKLTTLGVRASQSGLTYAWSRTRRSSKVEQLPADFALREGADPIWTRRRYRGGASGDPLWIWRVAREDLSDDLEAALRQRAFFPDVPEMRAEAAWLAAIELKPIGEHYYGPLDAQDIRDKLLAAGDPDVIRTRAGLLVPTAPLRALLSEDLRTIEPPYAGPDIEQNSWIWSGFSPSVLLSRTRAVYAAGLSIYEGFVLYFFPSLGPSLRLHQLLPAHVHGLLRPMGSSAQGMASAPGLTYSIDPLPAGSVTRIDIELAPAESAASSGTGRIWASVDQNAAAIAANRPDAPPWLTGSTRSTGLEVFGAAPATRLAEGWLAHDLNQVGWLARNSLR